MNPAASLSPTVHPMMPEEPHPIIGDYVDRLSASLIGVVPYTERARLRQETRDHLELLQADALAAGLDAEAAARKAIDEYGSSELIAEMFAESFHKSTRRTPLLRAIGRGRAIAFTLFSVPTLALTLLSQFHTFSPSTNVDSISVPLDTYHRVIPNNAMLPELTGPQGWMLGVLFITPFVFGALAGRLIPSKPSKAVGEVLPLLALYSFVVGTLMLPMNEMLLSAVIQVIYWIPVSIWVTRAAAAMKQVRSLHTEARSEKKGGGS